ncbi:MAG: 16S rRNA (cytosine(1402)-N(4))-methyltransferase RsmH [bacterium]
MRQPAKVGRGCNSLTAAQVFHIPVLVNEVLELLEPCLKSGTVIDATVGCGGHTEAIARRMKELGGQGQIVGFDVDPEAIKLASEQLQHLGFAVVDFSEDSGGEKGKNQLTAFNNRSLDGGRVLNFLVRTSYVNIVEVVKMLGVSPVTAVLMDLGVSSLQLSGNRGFSYESDGLLDMRFDPEGCGSPALEVLSRASELDLREWLRIYGEERFNGRIARKIFENKKRIRTGKDLAEIVRRVVPGREVRKSLARVFQTLRIVVNRELENLRAGLNAALRILSPGGRLVVICYQSGEDRCFKEIYRRERERGRVKTLSSKAIRPSEEEVKVNPRARSARLRVLEVIR